MYLTRRSRLPGTVVAIRAASNHRQAAGLQAAIIFRCRRILFLTSRFWGLMSPWMMFCRCKKLRPCTICGLYASNIVRRAGRQAKSRETQTRSVGDLAARPMVVSRTCLVQALAKENLGDICMVDEKIDPPCFEGLSDVDDTKIRCLKIRGTTATTITPTKIAATTTPTALDQQRQQQYHTPTWRMMYHTSVSFMGSHVTVLVSPLRMFIRSPFLQYSSTRYSLFTLSRDRVPWHRRRTWLGHQERYSSSLLPILVVLLFSAEHAKFVAPSNRDRLCFPSRAC